MAVDVAGWTDLTVESAGVLLHVMDWGGSGQAVLLTHGITAQAHVWDPVAVALRKRFRVLALDQRGHGESSKPPTGYAAADFAADMAAVIDALADGPALVMGHSLGGRNSLALAALHPESVAEAVSVEFGPWISRVSYRQLRDRVLGAPQSFESLEAAEAYLARRYSRLPADAIERRAKFGLAPTTGGRLGWKYARHSAAATLDLLDRDLDELLAAITVPVMVVHGAESGFYDGGAFKRLRSARPDFVCHKVPGADHYVPEERPDRVCRLFLDFAGPPAGTDRARQRRGRHMKFNVAVKVISHGDRLMVEVPAEVAAALSLGAEDVLCWTGLDDGTVEVWSVPKNPYQRLKDKG